MTPAESLASHRGFIRDLGETVLVRRYSGTGPSRTSVDTAAQARVTGYAPKDLVGAIVQGDRHVIMLVDTLAAVLPLRTTDHLVIRGTETSIKAVDDNTRRIAGVLIALDIQAAG